MEGKPVNVEVKVNQIRDGYAYDGSVSFDCVKFDYKIIFSCGIDRWMEAVDADPKKALGMISLEAKAADGTPVEMTDENLQFFLLTAGALAIDFYQNPQTRDTNEGLLGGLVRGEGFLGLMGSASIGMSTSYKVERTEPLEKLIEKYKPKGDA